MPALHALVALLLISVALVVQRHQLRDSQDKSGSSLQSFPQKDMYMLQIASRSVSRIYGNSSTFSSVRFEPELWSPRNISLSHNCYEYALNDLDHVAQRRCTSMLENGAETKKCRRWFHIPGYTGQLASRGGGHIRKYPKKLTTCPSMLQRVASDNKGTLLWKDNDGKTLEHDDICPSPSQYMAALVVDPAESQFHFYRRDHTCREHQNNGKICWSHKPGSNPVTRFDGNKQEMPDLRRAYRYHGMLNGTPSVYTQICGYFCVPANTARKTSSAFYPKYHMAK